MFTPRALEELVGEIYDEFDRDISGVQHNPTARWSCRVISRP